MARLGEFGAAQRELSGERDEFGFFEEIFTVVGAIPGVLMLQLSAAATGKIADAEGYAAMWEALRCSLTRFAPRGEDGRPLRDDKGKEIDDDDSQFTKLYKLAVEKSCDAESLMDLVFKLFEAQGGRPTREEPGSSPGRSTTSQSSSILSTPAAPSHLRSVDDLVRGASQVDTDAGSIQMGDGQIVAFVPAPKEQTG